MLKALSRLFLAPVARMLWRPRIVGRRNVPKSGAVMLASNHLSFIDSVVITLVAPRSVSFLAKSEYFTGSGLPRLGLALVLQQHRGDPGRARRGQRGAGCARQRTAGVEARRGVRHLPGGHPLARRPALPRSHRSRLARTHFGRRRDPGGADRHATTAAGGLETARTSARITVEFGAPLDLSAHGAASSGRARRKATDEIMAAIQKMSGQEIAGAYNEPPRAHFRRARAPRLWPQPPLKSANTVF